jgi:hypothetical protein
MIARVDRAMVPIDVLWWPAMNFGQFRWDHPIGVYELELSRAVFVERLGTAYQNCAAELQADDALVRHQEPSPLRDAGYPALAELPEHEAAFLEVVRVYLWDDVLTNFLPCPPAAGRFMVNSIDTVWASPSMVAISGRGYHAGPALTRHAEPGSGR